MKTYNIKLLEFIRNFLTIIFPNTFSQNIQLELQKTLEMKKE